MVYFMVTWNKGTSRISNKRQSSLACQADLVRLSVFPVGSAAEMPPW